MVVRNFEIYFAPIIIRLSQDIYKFMMEFFFRKDNDKDNQAELIDLRTRTSISEKVCIHSNLVARKPRTFL